MKNVVNLLRRTNSLTLKRVAQPYRLLSAQEIEIINDAFLSNGKVSVIPSTSFDRSKTLEGQICVAGIPLLLQKYPDQSMDIVITGVEKVRLLGPCGGHFQFACESVFENEKVTLNEDLALIGQLLWHEISMQKSLREQQGQLAKLLEEPESILNYACLLLVKSLSTREQIMQANSFDHKIHLLIDSLSPKKLGLSSYFRPITFSAP